MTFKVSINRIQGLAVNATIRLRPLQLALLGCGFQCMMLLSTPVYAGPANAVPTAPTPVTPSTTQYAALTPSAGCAGQYSNAINAATNTGLALQSCWRD